MGEGGRRLAQLAGQVADRRGPAEVGAGRVAGRQVAVDAVGQGAGLDGPDAHHPGPAGAGGGDDVAGTGRLGEPAHLAG